MSGKVLACFNVHDEITVCFFFWLLTFLTYEMFSDINYTLLSIIFNLLFTDTIIGTGQTGMEFPLLGGTQAIMANTI